MFNYIDKIYEIFCFALLGIIYDQTLQHFKAVANKMDMQHPNQSKWNVVKWKIEKWRLSIKTELRDCIRSERNQAEFGQIITNDMHFWFSNVPLEIMTSFA